MNKLNEILTKRLEKELEQGEIVFDIVLPPEEADSLLKWFKDNGIIYLTSRFIQDFKSKDYGKAHVIGIKLVKVDNESD